MMLNPDVTLLRNTRVAITIRFRGTFSVDDHYWWWGTITDAGDTGYAAGNPYSDKKEYWEEAG